MKLTKLPLELIIWVFALLILASINPDVQHLDLCLFKRLGLSWCPGCGIGHAICFLLHGELEKSLLSHPLGIIALPILFFRIVILAKYEYNKYSGKFSSVNQSNDLNNYLT